MKEKKDGFVPLIEFLEQNINFSEPSRPENKRLVQAAHAAGYQDRPYRIRNLASVARSRKKAVLQRMKYEMPLPKLPNGTLTDWNTVLKKILALSQVWETFQSAQSAFQEATNELVAASKGLGDMSTLFVDLVSEIKNLQTEIQELKSRHGEFPN